MQIWLVYMNFIWLVPTMVEMYAGCVGSWPPGSGNCVIGLVPPICGQMPEQICGSALEMPLARIMYGSFGDRLPHAVSGLCGMNKHQYIISRAKTKLFWTKRISFT